MAAKVHQLNEYWEFICPACHYSHAFRVGGDASRPQWWFDGKVDCPTFTPSLRVNAGQPSECHLTITNGVIKFHNDSHHALAGQEVPMEDW